MNRHPSGRPLRQAKRGVSQAIVWPREDYVVPRLNQPRKDLTGGFGFRIAPPDEEFYLQTWAKR